MAPFDLLNYTAGVLRAMGLRYFITGSTATIYYGEPRLTNDIDIVVDLPETRVAEFCRRFPEDQFYVSVAAAMDAVRRKSQFNVIHPASGLKVDIIVPDSSAFNLSRFARVRVLRTQDNATACISSPEDAIIKKLEYYRAGGSEKHLRDITGVLKISGELIDRAYIRKWTRQLGLEELWTAIERRVAEAQSGTDP